MYRIFVLSYIINIEIIVAITVLSGDDEGRIIPPELDNDGLAQAWFRFLHILGNPVDLCRPETISRTPAFVASLSQGKTFGDQHACLYGLPDIFLRAMKGLSVLVDAFLGW